MCKQEAYAAQRFETLEPVAADDAPNGENGEKRPEDRRPENGELKAAVQWNGAGQKEENDEKNEFVHGIGSLWGDVVWRSVFFEKYVLKVKEKIIYCVDYSKTRNNIINSNKRRRRIPLERMPP